jgi:hypothetical protein
MFGPPPGSGAPPSYTGLPIPGAGPLLLPPPGGIRIEQPITTEGLVRAESSGKSGWKEMPASRKLLILLSPLMVGAVLVIFMGDELGLGPPKGGGGKPRPPSTSQAAQRPTAPPTGEPTLEAPPSVPPPSIAVEPPPSASPSASSSVAEARPPTAPAPSPSRPLPPQPPSRQEPGEKSASGKTLQREAADAVAAGAFAKAAELYEQLAKKYPNRPAYAEAASILRAKAGKKP